MQSNLFLENIELALNNICLVPLSYEHEEGLAEVLKDGELWNLRITSTPHFSELWRWLIPIFRLIAVIFSRGFPATATLPANSDRPRDSPAAGHRPNPTGCC